MNQIGMVCLLCAASVAHAAPSGKVAISSRTRTVEIIDDAWGIAAFRMQIPEDWKFEGVVLRDPHCGLFPSVAYRLTSADGRAGYQVLPQFGWRWSDAPAFLSANRQFHCKTMPGKTPAEFLRYILPLIRPESTMGPIGPTPDAQQLDAVIAQYNQRAAMTHLQSRAAGGGVQTHLEYTLRGEAIEEHLRVVVQSYEQQVAGSHVNLISTANVAGVRAPRGQLESVTAAIAPLIVRSSATPEWIQRIERKAADDNQRAFAHTLKQGQDAQAMLQRNHEASMQESQRNFDRHQAREREREDAMHRNARAWTLYAGDEQLVRNAGTGEVSRVSSRAGTHAHQDNVSGDIVITNDPNFDPSFYLRGSWTQLENVTP